MAAVSTDNVVYDSFLDAKLGDYMVKLLNRHSYYLDREEESAAEAIAWVIDDIARIRGLI